MHVHPNQINPNAQTDALYAAERAAAKRAAEGTRKKLLEFAAELAGEAEAEEACVVKLGAREQGKEKANEQNRHKPRSGKNQKEPADAGKADQSISGWA